MAYLDGNLRYPPSNTCKSHPYRFVHRAVSRTPKNSPAEASVGASISARIEVIVLIIAPPTGHGGACTRPGTALPCSVWDKGDLCPGGADESLANHAYLDFPSERRPLHEEAADAVPGSRGPRFALRRLLASSEFAARFLNAIARSSRCCCSMRPQARSAVASPGPCRGDRCRWDFTILLRRAGRARMRDATRCW